MYSNIKEGCDTHTFVSGVERIQLQGNKTGHRSCPSKIGDKEAVFFDKKNFEPLLHDVDTKGGCLFVDAESPKGTYELLMASTSDIFGELVSEEFAEVSGIACVIYDSILTHSSYHLAQRVSVNVVYWM